MEQDIDGVMTEDEARAAGYLPTGEVPDLIGVQRNVRELGKTMRREGLRPVRVGHAYWWNSAAVEAWAARRRWIRPQGSRPAPCSAPGCDRGAVSHGLCLRHYKAARSKHAGDPAPRVGKPVGAGVYGRIDEAPRWPTHLPRVRRRLPQPCRARIPSARYDRRRIPRDLRDSPHDEACRAQRARAHRAQLGPP